MREQQVAKAARVLHQDRVLRGWRRAREVRGPRGASGGVVPIDPGGVLLLEFGQALLPGHGLHAGQRHELGHEVRARGAGVAVAPRPAGVDLGSGEAERAEHRVDEADDIRFARTRVTELGHVVARPRDQPGGRLAHHRRLMVVEEDEAARSGSRFRRPEPLDDPRREGGAEGQQACPR